MSINEFVYAYYVLTWSKCCTRLVFCLLVVLGRWNIICPVDMQGGGELLKHRYIYGVDRSTVN